MVLPVTTPLEEPMLATPELLLLHVPPPDVFVSVLVSPRHTDVFPPMVAGNGFTVTVAVILHPVGIVYVIVAVPPAIPVTIPEEIPTVAIERLLLLHVPLGLGSDSVIVEPWQNATLPAMADGNGLTVMTRVMVQPVGAV